MRVIFVEANLLWFYDSVRSNERKTDVITIDVNQTVGWCNSRVHGNLYIPSQGHTARRVSLHENIAIKFRSRSEANDARRDLPSARKVPRNDRSNFRPKTEDLPLRRFQSKRRTTPGLSLRDALFSDHYGTSSSLMQLVVKMQAFLSAKLCSRVWG